MYNKNKGYINERFKVRKGHALPCGERISCSLKISRPARETAALAPVNQTWCCCWTPRRALGTSLLQHSGSGAVQDFSKSLPASLFASTPQRPNRGKVFGNSCARQMGGRNGNLECWIVWMKHLGMDLKHYIASMVYWQNHWSWEIWLCIKRAAN